MFPPLRFEWRRRNSFRSAHRNITDDAGRGLSASPTIDRVRRAESGQESGQAAVEWSALLLVLAMLFGGLAYAVSRTEAWGLGEDVLHALVCAAGGGCDDGPDALAEAYGAETAKLVRRYAPNVAYERRSAQLPIDFRRCRKLDCSNGPSHPGRIDHSDSGLPVTTFTRVVDRRSTGGALYLQYWFYYPQSFTGAVGRIFGHRWPGYHADDWEGYQVRVGPDGAATARATAHGGYSSGWTPATGWYRVSGGSHAGQVVSGSSGERTTPAPDVRLAPLERLADLGVQRFAIPPPWQKDVYRDPESSGS
jgi:hypothetical protein